MDMLIRYVEMDYQEFQRMPEPLKRAMYPQLYVPKPAKKAPAQGEQSSALVCMFSPLRDWTLNIYALRDRRHAACPCSTFFPRGT